MADDIRTCRDLEERLTAYVDGEDTPAARRPVDGHLQACPSCAELARHEAEARQVVREHRDALCAHAHAPEALRARCARLSTPDAAPPALRNSRPPSFVLRRSSPVLLRWVPLSVAATLLLAVAGVFVFGLDDRVQALAATLAVDHVKCFKIAGADGHADAHASEMAWQANQGWPIVVPATDASRQLALLEVRRCLSSDGRAAHMLYTWRGEPLSLYVLQGTAGHDQIVRKMGQQAVIWSANRRTYAVVSGDTTQDLTPIVDYLRTRVQ